MKTPLISKSPSKANPWRRAFFTLALLNLVIVGVHQFENHESISPESSVSKTFENHESISPESSVSGACAKSEPIPESKAAEMTKIIAPVTPVLAMQTSRPKYAEEKERGDHAGVIYVPLDKRNQYALTLQAAADGGFKITCPSAVNYVDGKGVLTTMNPSTDTFDAVSKFFIFVIGKYQASGDGAPREPIYGAVKIKGCHHYSKSNCPTYTVTNQGLPIFPDQGGKPMCSPTGTAYGKECIAVGPAESPNSAQVAIQHSSFLAGEDAQAAGVFRIESGIVKEIRMHSGHYKPNPVQAVFVVNYLEQVWGIPASGYQVMVQKGGSMRLVDAAKVKAVTPNSNDSDIWRQISAVSEEVELGELSDADKWDLGIGDEDELDELERKLFG